MLLSDYSYDLPEDLIAKYPPEVRGGSRLLVLDHKTGELKDSFYRDLPDFLRAGDVLVLNETKVMSARLFMLDEQGKEHELIVLENHGKTQDMALYRGKLRMGDVLCLKKMQAQKVRVAEILDGGIARVEVIRGDVMAKPESENALNLAELAAKYGEVPLPPYLKREAEESDLERYQTEFAKNLGSAAAPTASLNLTREIIQRAEAKGVKVAKLTLHVGLGTFLPIRTDDLTDHKMHSEYYEIPETTLRAIEDAKLNGGRVVAVGTTAARALESFATSGEARGETQIFIYPGYEFKLVDALLTNFHAPKSTVLMLAAAFAGWQNLKRAYEYAVAEKYALLSYGDSMLIV
ncbi:MAG: tRNA preQ1(34) S-adenosylmethionine ribosyltransferase-isomerase QueA [Candidatus Nomurabacteria bacterium]|jgi:S-adenosylmethionine:tRNA ribosyltransferase-isomerase|nr:tRNA preQ1(34) S-adenosylmethionine ribosyltransferase-isomerase QueA [Candidatus Nomurabacteria bacterium]